MASFYGASEPSPRETVTMLEDELNLARVILASLNEEPEGTHDDEIASARAEVRRLSERLQKARKAQIQEGIQPDQVLPLVDANSIPGSAANGSSSSASSSSPHRTPSDTDSDQFIDPQALSKMSNRKRSFGTHLEGAPYNSGQDNKTPRMTPPLNNANDEFRTPSTGHRFQNIIDLTGDDADLLLDLEKIREAEAHFKQQKQAQDRDAAFARLLQSGGGFGNSTLSAFDDGMSSNSFGGMTTTGTTTTNAPPQYGQLQASSAHQRPTLRAVHSPNHWHHTVSSPLPTRPAPSPYTLLGQASEQAAGQASSSSAGQGLTLPVSSFGAYKNSMPGSFVDEEDEDGGGSPWDSEDEEFRRMNGMPMRRSLRADHVTEPFMGIGSSSIGYRPGVPALELARQNALARQAGGAGFSWGSQGSILPPPNLYSSNAYPSANGMSSYLPSAVNGGTYDHWPSATPPLANIIQRSNEYNWFDGTEASGNPFSERLQQYMDDVANDPRKNAEEIMNLLSNIRPDMEIPEEEREGTPDAMKYPLYTHQQLALKWMKDSEEGPNKGGILADDMGLGKTISTLALIVSRPSTEPNVKTNLIIGPVSLVKQWESECRRKLKQENVLSVFLLHGKKATYDDLRKYDVVLTTYGTIAMEVKRMERYKIDHPHEDYDNDPILQRQCPLLHSKTKFYRVILDEAQCIKNSKTQAARGAHMLQATHRWCLTGTPMMNGVIELYSLIRFLRIKPYNDQRAFTAAFGALDSSGRARNTSVRQRDGALKKLQAVLKAIMLRRMKTSTIDGKPILNLPAKIEASSYVIFSEDEAQFYADLQSKAQVTFNRYMRSGTIGKNYSNILTLLLRLRQACCHPHLNLDVEYVGGDVSTDDMAAMARELPPEVVERLRNVEAFECPICFDAVADPSLVIPCGHDTCPECLSRLTHNSAQNNIMAGREGAPSMTCPQCRGPVDPKKVISYTTFKITHMPEKAAEEGLIESAEPADASNAGEENDDESNSSTSEDFWSIDSDDDDLDDDSGDSNSDADENGDLKGFIVADGETDESEPESDDDDDDGLDIFKHSGKEEDKVKMSPDSKKLKLAGEKEKKLNKVKGKEKLIAKREGKWKGKGKGKAKPADETLSKKAKGKRKLEEVKPHQLKELRQQATKNKEARARYMKYLSDNWISSAKVSQACELLQEIQPTGEKTIVFSVWTGLLDLIEVSIRKELKLKVCRYDGSMSSAQRDEAARRFQEDGRVTVMLVSLRAGNAGLNLTAASRVIIMDPFWNPYIEMQAVDRAHRIGQQKPVHVHRILVRETVEDRIVALQDRKRQLVEAALDEGESKSLGRLTHNELAYLFGVRGNPNA